MAWKLFGRNWLTGIICMWSGLLVDIPNGWALCDGNNGTPDLRTWFVRGAPAGIDPGRENGNSAHNHRASGTTGFEDTHHHHSLELTTTPVNSDNHDVADIGGGVEEYGIHTHDIEGETAQNIESHRHTFFDMVSGKSHIPPHYEVAFIMKL